MYLSMRYVTIVKLMILFVLAVCISTCRCTLNIDNQPIIILGRGCLQLHFLHSLLPLRLGGPKQVVSNTAEHVGTREWIKLNQWQISLLCSINGSCVAFVAL